MKRVLLPTDYSKNADNAIKYALDFFGGKIYPAKVEFLIIHSRPLASPTVQPLTSYVLGNEFYGDLEDAEKQLKTICEKYHKYNPKAAIRSLLLTGAPSVAINEIAKEEAIDLIVMGTQGKGKIEKMIMGETAYQVAQGAPCPVLVVPENMTANPIHKIVFATDFRNLEKKKMLNPLKDILIAYQAELMTLHIYPEKETEFSEKDAMNNRLQKFFKTSKYKHFFFEYNRPAEGIAEFVNGYRADLLALVGKERSFFANLFHKSVTKQLLDHTAIPILILHPLHEWRNEIASKSIKEIASEQIEKLKTEADELKLQMYLGKKEAKTEFDQQKIKIKNWADDSLKKVNEAGKELSEDIIGKMKSSLENLKEKASAGMDKTEIGLSKQKDRLAEALNKLRNHLAEGKESVETKISKVSENIDQGRENFQTRLDMLAVQMNLGKKETKKELKERRKKAEKRIDKIKNKLEKYGDHTEQKWEHFKKEMKEALTHVREAFVGESK